MCLVRRYAYCLIIILAIPTTGLSQDESLANPTQIAWGSGATLSQQPYMSPSEVYCEDACGEFLFFSDYLWWQIRSEALPYAVKTRGLGANLVAEQKRENVETKYHSGVRLGLGYCAPCPVWDLAAEWTYLNAHDTSNAVGVGDSFLVPIWINRAGGPFANSAEADNKLKFNMADVNLGYTIGDRKHFSIRPNIGFRGVWTKEELNVLYSGGTLISPLLATNKINFRGYGVRGGIDVNFPIRCGFSLLAKGGGGLLWSVGDSIQEEFLIGLNLIRNRVDDSYRVVTPVFDIFVGIAYDICFCNIISHMNAHIGWEQHYFVNMIQFKQYPAGQDFFVTINQMGGLGLGGLTAGLTLFF